MMVEVVEPNWLKFINKMSKVIYFLFLFEKYNSNINFYVNKMYILYLIYLHIYLKKIISG